MPEVCRRSSSCQVTFGARAPSSSRSFQSDTLSDLAGSMWGLWGLGLGRLGLNPDISFKLFRLQAESREALKPWCCAEHLHSPRPLQLHFRRIDDEGNRKG